MFKPLEFLSVTPTLEGLDIDNAGRSLELIPSLFLATSDKNKRLKISKSGIETELFYENFDYNKDLKMKLRMKKNEIMFGCFP